MHPILYLISPPRARSTILFRALQAQVPAFTCFHEPSQAVHDQEKGDTYAATWWREEAFESHSEIQAAIISASTTGPVLVKEMSFACGNGLDPAYLQRPNLHFFFLVRSPLETIASFYAQVSDTLMPSIFSDDIGFKSMWELYCRVRKHCPNIPRIISNEEMRDPERLFRRILFTIDVETPLKLQWDPLPIDFDGNDWHEQKKPDLTRYWHAAAITSTSIDYRDSPIQTWWDLKSRVRPEHHDIVEEAYLLNSEYYYRLISP